MMRCHVIFKSLSPLAAGRTLEALKPVPDVITSLNKHPD